MLEPLQSAVASDPPVAPDDLVMVDDNRFRVHTRAYVDPAVFALEMRRIFSTSWVYLAHSSELPNPGDYKTTHMGLQPVIVSRGDDGDVNVMMNRCVHRGAVVCREKKGSANFFRCPYHGWVYGSDGTLKAARHVEEAALDAVAGRDAERTAGLVAQQFDAARPPTALHTLPGARRGSRRTRTFASASSGPSASAPRHRGSMPMAPRHRRNSSPWPARRISLTAPGLRRSSPGWCRCLTRSFSGRWQPPPRRADALIADR